jgi:3-phenylpropionate/trans-cinnamate dioxygenase ferredoxin subunit
MRTVDVCPVEELPPGEVKIVREGDLAVGVFNVNGELCAIEDRCSHDDGPLAEGDFDPDEGVVVCPRHGSRFEVCSGRPLTLPAYVPVATYRVRIEDGRVLLEVP